MVRCSQTVGRRGPVGGGGDGGGAVLLDNLVKGELVVELGLLRQDEVWEAGDVDRVGHEPFATRYVVPTPTLVHAFLDGWVTGKGVDVIVLLNSTGENSPQRERGGVDGNLMAELRTVHHPQSPSTSTLPVRSIDTFLKISKQGRCKALAIVSFSCRPVENTCFFHLRGTP